MKKKIVMVSTGGTIASKRNSETNLLTAGLLTGEELSIKCELPEYIGLEVVSAFQIPSNRMSFEKLELLKEKIEDVLADRTVDGIVVTHGTDTLEETAYFLDLTVKDDRPIVVTGSQRGPDEMGTDAFVNLRQSLMLAAKSEAQNFGTLVLFNERIYSARYVTKAHASNVAGFHSFGFGYLGIADQENIRIYQQPIQTEKYELKANLPAVEIVKCSLGSGDAFIRHAANIGLKGIVLEASGRGHVPPEIMDSIRQAIEMGVLIILTTATEEGDVKVVYDFPGSVYDLKNAGAILAHDYDSKKARIKLAVLLASETSKDELKNGF